MREISGLKTEIKRRKHNELESGEDAPKQPKPKKSVQPNMLADLQNKIDSGALKQAKNEEN